MRTMPLVLSACLLAGCGGSSSSPSSPTATSPVLHGRTINALDGEAATATVRAATRAVQTAADGTFHLELERSGEYVTDVSARGFVDRQTVSRTGLDASQQQLSLIPDQFDLQSFNEICRTSESQLHRWTRKPAVVVLTSVMTYNGPSETSYAATAERLTEAEVDQIVQDLTRALRLLSGGTWTTFDTVVREPVETGARASVQRDGMVVVGRYKGITSWSNTIGLGRWMDQPDGTVTAGAVLLDEEFDRADDRRWLLRMHEFGHALGYTHVTSRLSLMNPTIGPEPTTFDTQSAAIAYQRMPGNRAPDVDPSGSARPSGFISTGEPGRWQPPIVCGPPPGRR